jgi:hypothetical protein
MPPAVMPFEEANSLYFKNDGFAKSPNPLLRCIPRCIKHNAGFRENGFYF